MGTKICMNASCGTTTTSDWKKGWPLRSGDFADLCYKCGSAYENLVFCDMFHLAESGWRTCSLCSKRLHCGCIASTSLLELLDYGGVGCSTCAERARLHLMQGDGVCNGFGSLNNVSNQHSNRMSDSVDEGKLAQLCKLMEANEPSLLSQFQRGNTKEFFAQINGEEAMHPIREGGGGFAPMAPSIRPPNFGTREEDGSATQISMKESHCHPSLNITLGAGPSFVPPLSNGIIEGRERSKPPSPLPQVQRSRPILPKPPKIGHPINSEINKGVVHPSRVARPPADGRGKSQLLPRYWPRITDQELQKLSGELNSTIVPLFEKVLSASDAGRIGRLVLPKACAEAYFPHIYQSEGLPLKIQDVNGKEWTFQFRFWPNNNSRMYVLEGVTPCIQSMQLQAGDTVTFSRIDPGGKLVMGFRKAAHAVDMQDSKSSALPNGPVSWEASFPGVLENSTSKGYTDIFQTMKGSRVPCQNSPSENLNAADVDIIWAKGDNSGGGKNEEPLQQPVLIPEKKKTRNIGCKSKRLLMHNEDVLELRLTWEEAQDLLRPPPNVKPSIVTIDDHEFEEYDEPPVFGKRTIFITKPSGVQEQWAQCDDCSKWRRVPAEILLPPKWTCVYNVWDSSRCSCSEPAEMIPKQLDNIFRGSKDFKKRRMAECNKVVREHKPSGLDALASAAFLGDSIGESGESSIGATTKHPRHRPGCTCIVCIQPPSGKGKHKPTCTCNVCMTVKRRFKTLMLRKKKRQSEREAEKSLGKTYNRDEAELNVKSKDALSRMSSLENREIQNSIPVEVAIETTAAEIDLNCDPSRDDMQVELQETSTVHLVQSAQIPMKDYMNHNGITNILPEQHSTPSSYTIQEVAGERERCVSDEGPRPSLGWDCEIRDDGGYSEPNLD